MVVQAAGSVTAVRLLQLMNADEPITAQLEFDAVSFPNQTVFRPVQPLKV